MRVWVLGLVTQNCDRHEYVFSSRPTKRDIQQMCREIYVLECSVDEGVDPVGYCSMESLDVHEVIDLKGNKK